MAVPGITRRRLNGPCQDFCDSRIVSLRWHLVDWRRLSHCLRRCSYEGRCKGGSQQWRSGCVSERSDFSLAGVGTRADLHSVFQKHPLPELLRTVDIGGGEMAEGVVIDRRDIPGKLPSGEHYKLLRGLVSGTQGG